MVCGYNMEKQLKKKSNARLDEYLGFSWGWKLNFKRDGNAQTKSIAVKESSQPQSLSSWVEMVLWYVKHKVMWVCASFKLKGLSLKGVY